MTTPTRELANRARQIQTGSDGLPKAAARCVVVAFGCAPSIDVARSALQEVGLADVRKAAVELVDQLAAERIES